MNTVMSRQRDQLAQALERVLRGVVKRDEPLAPHTSLNVGGLAELWLEPLDLADLCAAIRIIGAHEASIFLIGNGTNCLVSDRGVRGVVISLRRGFREVVIPGIKGSRDEIVTAGAGVSMPLLAAQVSKCGHSGCEWACGIPGSVGGAVVMNAGAHGGDTAGCLVDVELVSGAGEAGRVDVNGLGFRYRRSNLPETSAIVVSARFKFPPDDPAIIEGRLREYRERRRATQPGATQSAGSVFKNPPRNSAGRLLESLGAKGMRVGGAVVSEKHANFIINAGGATADDVRTLISRLKKLAAEGAGVALETEVLQVGAWLPDEVDDGYSPLPSVPLVQRGD